MSGSSGVPAGAGAGASGDPLPPRIDVHAGPPATYDAQGHYETAAAWPIATGLTRGRPSPSPPKPVIPVRTTAPEYEEQYKIGEGQYSEVILVKYPTRSTEQFALKTMNANTAVRKTKAQREVLLLSQLKHVNICRLEDAYRGPDDKVHMLLEYCVIDLGQYIHKYLNAIKGADKLGEIKHILLGILNGVAFMHGKGIVHRDLKVFNILLKEHGGVKICDFGSSRKVVGADRSRRYTDSEGTVSTMAPEMLLKYTDYGIEVDMWSIACIISGLFVGKPFPKGKQAGGGDTFFNQLLAITSLCGNIEYPKARDASRTSANMRRLVRGNTREVRPQFQQYVERNNDALDLIDIAFNLDPSKRWTAARMMEHDFFHNNIETVYPLRNM